MTNNPYKTLILFAFIVFFLADASAQQVTVRGSAPGAEGKTIKLITWGDQITFNEKQVATATIDSLGYFSLSFDLPEISYIEVAIDLHRAGLYIQPGENYKLKIAEINYKDNLEVNPFIRSENLNIELVNSGDNELNIWINAYDVKYNQFLLDHFNALYLDRKKSYLDTFELHVNSLYHGIDQPYFQDYMRYKTAGLEQIAHSKNQYNLAKTYFIDRPILYNNVEYMQFFNNYFTKYMTVTSNILRKIDFVPTIMGEDPFPKLMKKMKADSVLKSDDLRELVMLKGLYEMFYKDAKLQDYIIQILDTIRTGSIYEGSRVVAGDMFDKVTKLRPGTEAPGFELTGRQKDETVPLKAFRGKPVILNFWTTFCEGCLAEMELQVKLYEKYKDKVEFVSICADRYWIKMNYFAMVKPEYAWNLLHYSGSTDLLVDYEVRTYPLYVVIDRYGDIYQFPAPSPSEGLERLIEEVIQ